jgi:carbon monoxide dehydrogenase subunit G
MMKVAGEHRFDAPPQEVWEALLDPEVLAATMPGCKKLEQTAENTYEGALDIKVGPVQGLFQGKVELDEIDPPNGYTMQLDGQGAPGFVKATARVSIAGDGDGTLLSYDGDAQVGGRIASVGQRLLDSSAKSIIRQSLEGLGNQIAARSGAAAGQPVEAPTAPTQAEVARQVAKDVAKDLVPKPVLVGGLILLVVLIILLFLLL